MNVDVFFAIFAKKVKKLRVGSDGGCALEIANGEGGIRTRGRASPTQPFQDCSLGHSDTSPKIDNWRLKIDD